MKSLTSALNLARLLSFLRSFGSPLLVLLLRYVGSSLSRLRPQPGIACTSAILSRPLAGTCDGPRTPPIFASLRLTTRSDAFSVSIKDMPLLGYCPQTHRSRRRPPRTPNRLLVFYTSSAGTPVATARFWPTCTGQTFVCLRPVGTRWQIPERAITR